VKNPDVADAVAKTGFAELTTACTENVANDHASGPACSEPLSSGAKQHLSESFGGHINFWIMLRVFAFLVVACNPAFDACCTPGVRTPPAAEGLSLRTFADMLSSLGVFEKGAGGQGVGWGLSGDVSDSRVELDGLDFVPVSAGRFGLGGGQLKTQSGGVVVGLAPVGATSALSLRAWRALASSLFQKNESQLTNAPRVFSLRTWSTLGVAVGRAPGGKSWEPGS
jgi:hypothetical protein